MNFYKYILFNFRILCFWESNNLTRKIIFEAFINSKRSPKVLTKMWPYRILWFERNCSKVVWWRSPRQVLTKHAGVNCLQTPFRSPVGLLSVLNNHLKWHNLYIWILSTHVKSGTNTNRFVQSLCCKVSGVKWICLVCMCIISRRLIGLGSFLECWQSANVTAIPKGAPSLDKENYHPISITPILSKVNEKLVSHKLSSFSVKYGLLPTA